MDPNEGIYSKFQHSVGVLKVPVVNGLKQFHFYKQFLRQIMFH